MIHFGYRNPVISHCEYPHNIIHKGYCIMQNKINREYLLKSHEDKLLSFEKEVIESVKTRIEYAKGITDVVDVFNIVSLDESSFNFEYFSKNDISSYPKNENSDPCIDIKDVHRCVLEVVPASWLLTENYESMSFTIVLNDGFDNKEVYEEALEKMFKGASFMPYEFAFSINELPNHLAIKKIAVQKFLSKNYHAFVEDGVCDLSGRFAENLANAYRQIYKRYPNISLLPTDFIHKEDEYLESNAYLVEASECFALELQDEIDDCDSDYILLSQCVDNSSSTGWVVRCPLLDIFVCDFLGVKMHLKDEVDMCSDFDFFEIMRDGDTTDPIECLEYLVSNKNITLIDWEGLIGKLANHYLYGDFCEDLRKYIQDSVGIFDWIPSLNPRQVALVIHPDLVQI